MSAREQRFDSVVGTGALGAGVVFRLEGDHDLGRNESRPAVLLDQRDYFKLHIILHYVSRLLRECGYTTRVVPVAAVGDDETGRRLLGDLRAVGMDLSLVRTRPDAPTTFGICFVYPDHSGGNLSPTNGATASVEDVRCAEAVIRGAGSRCLVLAAPEVDLDTRRELLRMGHEHGAFTVASYVTGEMGPGIEEQLRLVDLLSINLEEAAKLAGRSARDDAEATVRACVDRVRSLSPSARISITHGEHGAWAWEAGTLEHLGALRVDVASTAGAGDATLSGYILGLAVGLPFLGPGSCFRLSRLLGAMSVTSPDTIHFGVTLDTLRSFAANHGEAPVL